MAAIRSRDTRPELVLRAALRGAGLQGYRCHVRGLPGQPDITFTRWRVAVFIDGAFWHGHPDHFEFGRLGQYWDDKIRRTQDRDFRHTEALEKMGYCVLRFWDFDILKDAAACSAIVEAHVCERRVRPLDSATPVEA